MQQRRTLVILLVLILGFSTHVRSLIPTDNQKQNLRSLNVVSVDDNVQHDDDDERNSVDAAKWRTKPHQNTIIPRLSRDQTKCTSRSLIETETMMTCNQSKPCPDPIDNNDWIQDRCEIIFATIGTIWAYCSSTSSNIIIIPVVYHIHQTITFLSMKIKTILRSIFDDRISGINNWRLHMSFIGL